MIRTLVILLGLMAVSAAPSAQELPLRNQDYIRDAVQLADVLGSAHGVRYVCNGKDDQYWRVHMITLLRLEAPDSGALRSSLVRAFNNAFSNAQQRYPICDTRAVDAEAQYAEEGRDLSDRLAAYYLPR
ncbi:MAG: TIGR02301 family protein [Pseudomonadota bacterium]